MLNSLPLHDADGNAVLIRTTTGVWQVSYNGENRPIRFENATTETVIMCSYDAQGRRFEKKVTVAGTITSWERYLYRDYFQIAVFDITETESSSSVSEEGDRAEGVVEASVPESLNYALKRIIYWEPSESVATKALFLNPAERLQYTIYSK